MSNKILIVEDVVMTTKSVDASTNSLIVRFLSKINF